MTDAPIKSCSRNKAQTSWARSPPHMAAVLDRVFHDTLNDMPGVCGEAGF